VRRGSEGVTLTRVGAGEHASLRQSPRMRRSALRSIAPTRQMQRSISVPRCARTSRPGSSPPSSRRREPGARRSRVERTRNPGGRGNGHDCPGFRVRSTRATICGFARFTRFTRFTPLPPRIILPAEIQIVAPAIRLRDGPLSSQFPPGRTYFFTVTLADRQASLLTDRIDALGAASRHCRGAHSLPNPRDRGAPGPPALRLDAA